MCMNVCVSVRECATNRAKATLKFSPILSQLPGITEAVRI